MAARAALRLLSCCGRYIAMECIGGRSGVALMVMVLLRSGRGVRQKKNNWALAPSYFFICAAVKKKVSLERTLYLFFEHIGGVADVEIYLYE